MTVAHMCEVVAAGGHPRQKTRPGGGLAVVGHTTRKRWVLALT